MRKILKSKDGFTEVIGSIFVITFLVIFLSGIITTLGELSKRDNLNQIAQQMARHISLTGRVDAEANDRLRSLSDTLGLEVTMNVDGSFVGATNKLRTESDFTIIIHHNSKYRYGGIINPNREKTYQAKAKGTVEEYHKD